MAKTLSVYITTEEAKELEKFCDEHNCTPYRALRLGLHLLLETRPKETKPQPKEQEAKQQPASTDELWKFLGQT